MKRLAFTLLCLFSLTPLRAGEDWVKFPVGPYGGLNNRDNSYAIQSSQSQDLLNIELTPGGKSVKKRHGYGIAFSLSQTTSPVHGVYDFFDSNGNEVNLFFNDTKVFGSVGGAATTVLLSTAAFGATWQCADSLGQAYCANTSRTTLYKISGSTLSQIQNVSSTGTMVATCVTRLAMAGFSDAPSRIDLSTDGDFTTWGTGSLGSSPVQITVNAPGAKVTHITYAFGRLMWFKDTSFGYVLIGNQPLQTDWVVKTVAYDVGTNDNTSVYREGVLFFRGKDGHIYTYDGNTYQRLSREIAGTVNQAQTRSQNSWAQSSQSDFAAGATTPQAFISSSIVSGSLMPSSFTFTETTNADFLLGTFSNTSSTGPFVWLSIVNHNLFDTNNAWGFENASPTPYWFSFSGTGKWTPTPAGATSTDHCGNTAARTGSGYAIGLMNTSPTSGGLKVCVTDVKTGTLGACLLILDSQQCSYTQKTLSAATINIQAGKAVNIKTYFANDPTNYMQSSSFTWSNQDLTFYYTEDTYGGGAAREATLDDFAGGYSVSTGTYTSKSYDMNLSTNLVRISSIGITTNQYQPTITLQTSNDGSNWRQLAQGITTSTSTSYVGNRYVRYIASFTVTNSSDALSSLDDVTLIAHSSGTFFSAVNNSPNLTSWDTLGANYQNDGGGTVTFYVRGRSGVFLVTDSTPAWVVTVPGAVITASTGAYNQVRADFSLNTATENPTVNDFTLNWFEGSASDKSYATYFDDKILFSAPIGTGTTANNKELIYDMLNQTWLIWDLPANGFYVKANKLYFGSSSGGYIFKYGDVENDNTAAINSYWQSKDFFGDDPFSNDEIDNISLAAKAVSNSTMTVTYVVNGSSSASFNFPLTSSNLFVNKNKKLPAGVNANNSFNVKVGNNAVDQPWELFGVQVGLRPKTWIPN